MRLQSLRAKNFRSFEEIDLELNASGVFSITGRNGAGKSTIFDAVEWALYGSKRGGGAQTVRRRGSEGEECRVELEFEVDGRLLRALRIDGDTASLVDVGSGAELASSLSGTSREVAVQLGLTQDMFRGTFFARQKEVEALASKDSRERKEKLEGLLGISHLRKAVELATEDTRERFQLLQSLRSDPVDLAELQEKLARSEKEAEEAAPTVTRLDSQIAERKEELTKTHDSLAKLLAQVKEHGTSQIKAEQAEGDLKMKKEALEQALQRLDTAKKAKAELSSLEAGLRGGEDLEAREREMTLKKQSHERHQRLLGKEREALSELATASDAFGRLGNSGNVEEATRDYTQAQQRANELGSGLQKASEAHQKGLDRRDRLVELLKRAERAAQIDQLLEELGGAGEKLEASRRDWQELRDQRASLKSSRDHCDRHRQALLGDEGDDSGVCPVCHRELEEGREDLIAGFDAEIDRLVSEISACDKRLGELEATGKDLATAAERESRLRGERESLPESGDPSALAADLAGAEQQVETAAKTKGELQGQQETLTEEISRLKEALEKAERHAAERRRGREELTKAEQHLVLIAEQLAESKSEDYDPAVHAQIAEELATYKAGVQQAAALRERSAVAELLEKQIPGLREAHGEAEHQAEVQRQQAKALAPPEGAEDVLVAKRDRLEAEVNDLTASRETARLKVSGESEAVAEVRGRIEEVRKLGERIEEETREHAILAALAQALDEYREEVSRRTRPMLEEEASRLLRRVSEATYPRVRLTDKYKLEIADRGEYFPSQRYSGGEQDLAALCMRLALARTLSEQRGTEQNFVILDEVFGSQDVDRRRLLMEQLTELAKADFQQIFVISHTEDVVDQCALNISVNRENGISRVSGPRS